MRNRGRAAGATMTETILIVTGVAVAVLLAVTAFGRQQSSLYARATRKLQEAPGGGGAAENVPSSINPATPNATGMGAAGGADPDEGVSPAASGTSGTGTGTAGAAGGAPGDPPSGEPRTLAEAIARARQFDFPHRQQQGAECGFAALGMVMDYYHAQNERNPNPPTEGENGTKALALRRGYITAQNTFIRVGHLSQLARDLGYQSSWGENKTVADIKKELAAGHGVLVLTPVDRTGTPNADDQYKGWGHFAAVEGFVTFQGKEYMIVKHGWKNESVAWPVDAFEEAWGRSEYKRPMAVIYR